MATETDFAALYRELGIDATCSLAELRSAWRRRVAKLHPDQGGSAEDTRRLQELNRLRDAAMRFHTRHGRMPGAISGAATAIMAAQASPTPPGDKTTAVTYSAFLHASDDRTTSASKPLSASGFGRISRYFTTVSLIAIAVLGWRVVQDDAPPNDVAGTDEALNNVIRTDHARDTATGAAAFLQEANHGSRESGPATISGQTIPVKQTIMLGMGKNTVRNILGEPLDMHALRWTYGPSWVAFHCDKVAGWYSSPLRPLRGIPAHDMQAKAAYRGSVRADGLPLDHDRCR